MMRWLSALGEGEVFGHRVEVDAGRRRSVVAAVAGVDDAALLEEGDGHRDLRPGDILLAEEVSSVNGSSPSSSIAWAMRSSAATGQRCSYGSPLAGTTLRIRWPSRTSNVSSRSRRAMVVASYFAAVALNPNLPRSALVNRLASPLVLISREMAA
jgi:hypothetical protein